MIRWQSEDVMKCFKKVDMIRVSPYQQMALVDQLRKVTFREVKYKKKQATKIYSQGKASWGQGW